MKERDANQGLKKDIAALRNVVNSLKQFEFDYQAQSLQRQLFTAAIERDARDGSDTAFFGGGRESELENGHSLKQMAKQ